MRIKKYENWKLNNINQSSVNWKLNNLHQPIINNHQQINKHNHILSQQQSFSISQLLETPKKQLNKQREHNIISKINIRENNNYFQLTNLKVSAITKTTTTTTNLNQRLLQKTQIYLYNNNTNDNTNDNTNNNINNSNNISTSTFRTHQQQQQRTQREQIIKHKIKQRIKQQYLNCNNDDDDYDINSSSFHYIVGMTNRSFFNNNNNNNNIGNSNINNINNNNYHSNRKGDFIMALSFDQRASRCFDSNNNNYSNTVHIKGKSFPINSSFTHKRSKSTVIKRGLINLSTQKHHNQQFNHYHQQSSYNNNNSYSTRKRVYSVQMKRQNSFQSNMKQQIHPKYQLTTNNNNNKNNNKIYLKDIQPWQFDIGHDGFDINI